MSPYDHLPSNQFWKRSIPGKAISEIDDLYRPKFSLDGLRIATAGSCFAQYISRQLSAKGYDVVDTEPAPPHLSEEDRASHGYGLYSARYGNIYTARQLLQLLQETTSHFKPSEIVWSTPAGRYCDALRPGVEPNGLAREDLVLQSRREHLARVRAVFQVADVFIFTFGLTEAWVHSDTGSVFPIVPGTRLGGEFKPDVHRFHNFSFQEIYADFLRFRRVVTRHRPGMKYILTVSPVPLVATATGNHVLSATTYSKSVLRAVAGQLAAEHDDIDYFPSYEIITAPFFQRSFYDPDDAREVTDEGVQTVMDAFFRAHGSQKIVGKAAVTADGATDQSASKPQRAPAKKLGRPTCEEVMLDAFDKRSAVSSTGANASTALPKSAKTLRLCAMGDSHIAAMKHGWDLIEADHPDVSIQFFAAPGSTMRAVYIENGKLLPKGTRATTMFRLTSGGETVLDPARFDAFVLCGLRFRLRSINEELVQEYLDPETDMTSAAWRAGFEAIVVETLKDSLSFKTALLLRRVTNVPIIIFAQPLPIVPPDFAENPYGEDIGKALAAFGGIDEYVALIKRAARALPSTVATVIWQSPDTTVGGLYTKPEFQIELDRAHMNGAFGALAFTSVLEHLAGDQSRLARPHL